MPNLKAKLKGWGGGILYGTKKRRPNNSEALGPSTQIMGFIVPHQTPEGPACPGPTEAPGSSPTKGHKPHFSNRILQRNIITYGVIQKL